MALVTLVIGACGSAAVTASPRPARAASFDEYAVAFCSAFDSMFRAIGNPDTGEGSELTAELDRAIAAGDLPAVERLAGTITAELGSGRQHAAVAGGWQPGAPVMTQLDRVLVAFEAMVAAKRAGANHVPGAPEPQAAFESAGGVAAWFAMLEAARAMERPAGAAERRCPTVPIGP